MLIGAAGAVGADAVADGDARGKSIGAAGAAGRSIGAAGAGAARAVGVEIHSLLERTRINQ